MHLFGTRKNPKKRIKSGSNPVTPTKYRRGFLLCGIFVIEPLTFKDGHLGELVHPRGHFHLGRTLCHGELCLGQGGLILHRGSSFSRLYLSRLGGIVYLPGVGNTFLSSAT